MMRAVSPVLIVAVLSAVVGCGSPAPPSKPAPAPSPTIGSTPAPVPAPPLQPVKETTTPAPETKPTPPDPPKPITIKATPGADFSLSSVDYAKEWKKDEKAAYGKYHDKSVALTGVVSYLTESPDLSIIQLKTDKEGDDVTCFPKETNFRAKLVPGQTVTLLGKSSGEQDATTKLEECRFVEIGPSPAVAITVKQLAQEYGQDKAKAIKTYDEKWLFLTGEILESTKQDKSLTLVLKSGNDVRVEYVFLWGADDKRLTALKPGQEVKVVTQFNGVFQQAKKLTFTADLIADAK
jgi:tRNA_anti-like